jgi:hypothetical protein
MKLVNPRMLGGRGAVALALVLLDACATGVGDDDFSDDAGIVDARAGVESGNVDARADGPTDAFAPSDAAGPRDGAGDDGAGGDGAGGGDDGSGDDAVEASDASPEGAPGDTGSDDGDSNASGDGGGDDASICSHCTGCCDPLHAICRSGAAGSSCGSHGETCQDCTSQGKHCVSGACQ